jgi:hypothetical protein
MTPNIYLSCIKQVSNEEFECSKREKLEECDKVSSKTVNLPRQVIKLVNKRTKKTEEYPIYKEKELSFLRTTR